MPHICVITTGLTGILHASFELVSRLKAEGHTVTYLSIRDVKEKVEKQGIPYVQLPDINRYFSFRSLETNKSSGILKAWFYHIMNISDQYEQGINMLNFDKYEKILGDIKPDLALIDEELHELIFSAIVLNIPVTLLSQFFSYRMRTNLPPIRTAIIPGIGIKGHPMGIMSAWFYIKLKIWGRILINRATLRNNRRSILKMYAKKIKFPVNSLISRNFPSQFIHQQLPILSMTMRELEFPHSKPKNITYIGAMVCDNRDYLNKGQLISKKLDQIFSLKKKLGSKIIYCSVTSMKKGGDVVFLKKVIKAVTEEPEWRLIISLGDSLSQQEFQLLPNNVYLFDWVPQLKVLQQADCSINHGGIHTINECIHLSVPMLIYSGKRYDQNGNAARVAYHGLGIMGNKDKDNAESIRHNIYTILNQPSFNNRISEFNKIYKATKQRQLTSLLQNSFCIKKTTSKNVD